MKTWTVLMVTWVGVCAWECGVTGEWESANITPESVGQSPPLIRSNSLAGIRLRAFLLTNSTSALWQSIADVLPNVLNWYSRILQVHRLTQPLVLPTSICGPGVEVPAEHYSEGVADADFLVYVVPLDTTEKAAGKGLVCAFEGGNSQGNPLAGTIWLNEKALRKLSRETLEDVLLHELAHTLAISWTLFQRYRQSDGSLYVDSISVHGSQRYLSTPMVQYLSRLAFRCPELPGIALDGSMESHWRGKMMLTDFMLKVNHNETIHSILTLAAFQDSGWYEVDLSYGEKMRYGAGKGCDFLFGDCIAKGKSQYEEFCDLSVSDMCDFSGRRKATCGITHYKHKLPKEFQWFDDKKVGGLDPLADYCPYNNPDIDGDCRGISSVPTMINKEAYGEESCSSCRCFTGSYISSHWAVSGLPIHSGCHRVTCMPSKAVVSLGKVVVECPVRGGIVTNIEGFVGNITCPRYERLCLDRDCPQHCSNSGQCENGMCHCFAGFYGSNCGHRCHETCAHCLGASREECTECYPHAEMTNGACQCEDGFVFDEKEKCVWNNTRCHPHCTTCSGPESTQCLTCPTAAELDITGTCKCTASAYISSGTCVACSPACQRCIGPRDTDCTECHPSFHISNDAAAGACICLERHYKASEELCEECHPSCSECVDDSSKGCTSCNAFGAVVTDGECACTAGFYLSADYMSCLSCHPTCWTCTGASQFDCTSCSQHASLQGTECKCDRHYQLSSDLSACIQGSSSSPCVSNYSSISTLIILFFISVLAGRRLIQSEKLDLQVQPSDTELTEIRPEPQSMHSGRSEPASDSLPLSLRIGVFTTALIWGGFFLALIYLLASDEPLSVSSAKHSISSFNLNDVYYTLLTFLTTLGLNYTILRLYSDYRVSSSELKPDKLRKIMRLALAIIILSVLGTCAISFTVCDETGGLWMVDFCILFWLEIGISQLMLKLSAQRALREAAERAGSSSQYRELQ